MSRRNRRPDLPADLPPGAIVRATVLPESPKLPPCPRFAPGEILATFRVPGHPSPWRPARICRNGSRFKEKPEVRWKAAVQAAARLKWANRPYDGPVDLMLYFYVVRGVRGAIADVTNLVKSTEDAIKGIVFLDDRQVCRIEAERVVVEDVAEHALIRVAAPGRAEP